MSIPSYNRQCSFFDTGVAAANLFGPSDRHELFRLLVLPALEQQREALCALYCEENGRPGIEPVVMAGVTLLQFMENLPDRQAAEMVRMHLGWKHALNLEVGYEGFHPTSLVKFRGRLVESEEGRLVFDAILQALEEAGLVKRRGTQRLDSTHVLGCVSRMGRLEVVRETIRLFLQSVDSLAASTLLPRWDTLLERYVHCEIQWHRAGVPTLKEKFLEAGEDMLALIKWARQYPPIRSHDRMLLLERVFLEQYELSSGAPQRRRQEDSGVVKNPHDPDAQWAAKDKEKKKQWVGYKVQVAETLAPEEAPKKEKGEPTEQFLTEVTTTEAIASDLEGRRRVEQQQEEHGLDVADELYVDSAYVSAEELARAEEQGRVLMGPALGSQNSSGKKLFTAEDFEVDIAARQAICPAGHVSRQCSSLTNAQSGKVDYRFEWGALCDQCELRAKCTRARNGRRALVVGEHHTVLQQRRKEMKTDEFAKRMYRRNGIEGTISELVRGGARRTRYRGLVKTALANYFHAAAVNAKRWIRFEAAKRPREDRPEGQKRRRTPMWAVIWTITSRMWALWHENRDVRACAA
jgi:transposase